MIFSFLNDQNQVISFSFWETELEKRKMQCSQIKIYLISTSSMLYISLFYYLILLYNIYDRQNMGNL